MNWRRTTRMIIPLSFIVLILICAMAGCGGSNNPGNDQDPGVPDNPPANPYTGVPFTMCHVPGAAEFPINSADGFSCYTVSYPYYLSETEVTYKLWKDVYDWAQQNGYSICDSGWMGDGTGDNDQHPVTYITWRSAMVWCNALTEYYNAKNGSAADLDCVYYADATYSTPLRTSTADSIPDPATDPLVSGGQDQPYIKATDPGNIDMANCIAKGFRLPTGDEWELAARYIGPVQPGIEPLRSEAVLRDGLYWTPGDYASGATADYNSDEASEAVAWYSTNSDGTSHPVKHKSPNALGLYDMSGNVEEWCFDWAAYYTGERRVTHGGSWNTVNTGGYETVRIGDSFGVAPDNVSAMKGFRIARTE